MAWIEVHQELPWHPKTDRMMDLAGVERPTAVGLVVGSILWALQYAPDGVIERERLGSVARFVGATQAPAALAELMVAARWWDVVADGWSIHDWDEYAGRLIERRRADAARKRQGRSGETSGGRPADVPGTSSVHYPTLPNPTVPDHSAHARVHEGPGEESRPGDGVASLDYFRGELALLKARYPRRFDGASVKPARKATRLDDWLAHPRAAREAAYTWASAQPWPRDVWAAALDVLTNPKKYPSASLAPGRPGNAPAYAGWSKDTTQDGEAPSSPSQAAETKRAFW